MDQAIGLFFLLVLMGIVCCLVNKPFRDRAAANFDDHPWYFLVLAFCLILWNGFAMWSTNAWNREFLVTLAVYLGAPALMLFAVSLVSPRCEKSDVLALVVVFMLWLPVESRFVLKGFRVGGMSYPFIAASALTCGLAALAWKGKSDICLDWSFRKCDLKSTLKFYLLLAAVMIPCTVAFGFITPGINPTAWRYPYAVPLVLVVFWFFPALAEELIFRAGIQNALVNKFGRGVGLVVASLIFGLAHINNKVKCGDRTFEFPNWHYVVFASIAGFAYGLIYLKRKKAGSRNALGVAALLHALVDFTWWLMLKGGQ